MLSQYKDAFLGELDEILELMDDEILQLEQNPSSLPSIQALFRAAHTIKGSSAAMGLEQMKQVMHEIEHILDKVRSGLLYVTDPLIELLFMTIDILKMMKEEIEEANTITTDATALIRQIHLFLAAPSMNNTGGIATEPYFPEPNDLSKQLADKGKADQAKKYKVEIWLSDSCEMPAARTAVILSELREQGWIVYDPPDLGESRFLSLALSSEKPPLNLQNLVSSMPDVVQVRVEESKPQSPAQSVVREAEVPVQKAKMIRMNVQRLEHMINLVGELTIDQTRLRRIRMEMDHVEPGQSVKDLDEVTDHIGRLVGELQDCVMKARMLPVEQLFGRFPRMVRDLAQSVQKGIEFIVEGKETELDRTIIEEVGDPIIHLIRNAIDHGIEPVEVRRERGKPDNGRVCLRATHEDNHIVISIEDDGGGIDPTKVRESAVAKGIIGNGEDISHKEAIELIFHPGFSTAAQVSDISGRGVGMDIVKTRIEQLNGLIEVDTEIGKGTKFKIKLPLTLAIVSGLLVATKHNHRIFVLPMNNVMEIMRVTYSELGTIQGETIMNWRNRILPVVWLHDLFHIPHDAERKEKVPIIIIGLAEKRIALAVDELIGNQDVVIKSLGSYLGKVQYIMGSTILGNGQIALILEIMGMMNRSLNQTHGGYYGN